MGCGSNHLMFDPLKLMQILRGKRLMFVGDSVQRGQFESLVCMVQSIIPQGKKSIQRVPPRKIFKVEEFDASIEYYWAPFIVESISDHATKHTVLKRLVKLDSIAKHGKHWEGVDILVFESYVWWMHKPTINVTYGSPDVQEYNVTTAYRLALQTWAEWLESSINPVRQKVFFMSMSPTHLWSWEWKAGSDENCFNESYPIQVVRVPKRRTYICIRGTQGEALDKGTKI
ncbi:protein trichome birefringence-like 31 [Prunus yedoensis var. nudiflora]|uniref:Protein trichome birefringence-like 31 n=1 Tax=Prunus yedoensis var. nudiflora TaxID=2094558 RepID=A0A314XVT7_PRUYE|nr:protein trichome birefringence-like 31 [Prunus yedoensis var. nudiflora]